MYPESTAVSVLPTALNSESPPEEETPGDKGPGTRYPPEGPVRTPVSTSPGEDSPLFQGRLRSSPGPGVVPLSPRSDLPHTPAGSLAPSWAVHGPWFAYSKSKGGPDGRTPRTPLRGTVPGLGPSPPPTLDLCPLICCFEMWFLFIILVI